MHKKCRNLLQARRLVTLLKVKNKLLVHMYIVKNTTIFLIVRLLLLRYNYMFRPSMSAIFTLYMKHLVEGFYLTHRGVRRLMFEWHIMLRLCVSYSLSFILVLSCITVYFRSWIKGAVDPVTCYGKHCCARWTRTLKYMHSLSWHPLPGEELIYWRVKVA